MKAETLGKTVTTRRDANGKTIKQRVEQEMKGTMVNQGHLSVKFAKVVYKDFDLKTAL